MPLPPLDEEEGNEYDDMFPTVAERSLSPDQAFETFRITPGSESILIRAKLYGLYKILYAGGWGKVRAYVVKVAFHRYSAQ